MSALRWPTHCGCVPGDEAAGWHERRCDECRQVELNQWSHAMETARRFIRERRIPN